MEPQHLPSNLPLYSLIFSILHSKKRKQRHIHPQQQVPDPFTSLHHNIFFLSSAVKDDSRSGTVLFTLR